MLTKSTITELLDGKPSKKAIAEILVDSLQEGIKTFVESDSPSLPFPFEVGKAYFFRTVTYHVLGRVKKIVGKFLVLEKASWIADSGRFHQFITKGEISSNAEIEPAGAMIVNTDTITDAEPWDYTIPEIQK